MRRTGTILLWSLWFAAAAIPWAATRLGLFANLVGTAHSLLGAAWYWALATALGWRTLELLRHAAGNRPFEKSPHRQANHLLFSAGIGLGLLAGANLAWGTLVGVSHLKFLALDILLALLAGPGWTRAGHAAGSTARATTRVAHGRPLLAAGIGVLLLGTLPFALVPTLFPDTLRYHFGLTRFFESAGRIIPLPDFAESNISLNWQMLYLGQLEVTGDLAAQAFNWMTLPLLAAALAAAAPRGGRALAVGVALSTPFLLGVSATANNDLGVALFVSLMWLAMREWEGRGRWLMAGIFGGMAVGTKYPAAFAVAAAFGAALGLALFGKALRRDSPVSSRGLAAFLAGGFAGYLPWFLRSAWLTGDPLYPSLSRFLPWATENGRWVAESYGRELARYGGGMEGIARWALAPWRATLAPDPWFESDLGLAVWLALPLAALAFRGGPRARLVAVAAWLHAAGWAAGPQVTRFLAPAAPAFALAAAEGWILLGHGTARRAARPLLVVALAANIWVSWMALAEATDPFTWFLKRPTREAYLAAHSPIYRVARELERRTDAHGTVLLFGVEGHHFFANPIRASGPFDQKWIVRESAAARTPEELAARLRAAGIRFLFLDPWRIDCLDRQFGYASWPDPKSKARFLDMARFHANPFLLEIDKGVRDLGPVPPKP